MLGPRPLIAIVDDEEQLRVAIARVLRAHGYEVVSLDGGEALLAELERRRIDCILLDLMMPGMSGFEVLAALRERAASPPVIVISAQDDPAQIQRALALNARECQRKPVGAPVLLGAIERACVAQHS